MAIVYVLGSLSVLIYNYDQVGPAVVAIFGGVFSGTAATGGFLGATVALAFNRGVNRGLFSNEAGQGSAPIAHAAAKAEDPVSEWSLPVFGMRNTRTSFKAPTWLSWLAIMPSRTLRIGQRSGRTCWVRKPCLFFRATCV